MVEMKTVVSLAISELFPGHEKNNGNENLEEITWPGTSKMGETSPPFVGPHK